MHSMLNITSRAARKAGDFLAKYYDNIEASNTNKNHFLTYVNKEAERLMIEIILKYYPKHTVINEQSGQITGRDRSITWIIYPIDSINNFIKRIPHIAVSISVCFKGRTEIAVVYDPMRNELFSTIRGHGAQMNSYRLRSSSRKNLAGTILSINSPIQQQNPKYYTEYSNLLLKLLNNCIDLRCTGSSTLDIAYLAAGRVDCLFLFDIGLTTCHTTSELLVVESGGWVKDFNLVKINNNIQLDCKILAGNSRIVQDIINIISK
ncbi:inositol monophosphatase family protein [Candidatus Palibaumannia cicadellinicola]|uniref:Inositol-1-monophosphatase n=1 Tax=Candidatus Palibaumannia cicadellinicola TaxID=186490 RepID=A0A0K2BKR7_9GAMM|nr:inositol monophosphatase family protein [Candidatus Baumannia cicadellinicola]AKZ65633.1 Inositol-1-monophosphatase [Candidatus Baumannia cicadellinicola]